MLIYFKYVFDVAKQITIKKHFFISIKMIRRKLTRIEVTLDDTKEIDDLFAKTSQANVCTQTHLLPNQTTSSSKIISNYQKQLLFLTKPQDFAKTTESPIETIAVSTAITTITNSIVNTNNTTETAQTTQPSPSNTETQPASNTNDQQTSYNPQPYNPSNRFQLNQ